MRIATLFVALAAFSAASGAADYIVDFDRQVDFAAVRTFALRGAEIQIDRPEVRSPLVPEQITAAIRKALTSRGLRETTDAADVIVDWSVTGQRFAINEWGHAIPLNQVPGGVWIDPGNPWRNLPEAFVNGVLVVDLTAQSSGLLIWRGVYRNREQGTAKLAHQLPNYATKLLAGYPAGKK